MKHKETKKDTMPTYWHCSTVKYNVGDIINTGNFYNYGAPTSPLVSQEFLLEAYRMLNVPYEVSRINCIFACETKEALINFMKKCTYINNLFVYKIKPVKKCNVSKKNFLSVDIFKAGAIPKNLYNNEYNEYIELYWLKKPPKHLTEILIPVNCKIINLYSLSINLTLI